jgi:purine-binding chemotaxis protein CheW
MPVTAIPNSAARRRGEQFVTLGVDCEMFAVPVALVREILDLRPLCRMPEAPPDLAGLTDVRGRTVPVIDLRVKLGRSVAVATDATRILVLDVDLPGRRLELGLIADRVCEVTALDGDDFAPAPDIGTGWHCDYVQGIGRRGEQFVIILDLARLLGSDELALLPGGGAAGDAAPAGLIPPTTMRGTVQESIRCA